VRNGYKPERAVQTGIGEVAGGGEGAAGARSGRRDQISLEHPAGLSAPHQKYRRAVALVVFERLSSMNTSVKMLSSGIGSAMPMICIVP